MTLLMCLDCNRVSKNRLPKMTEFRFFHPRVGINRPQNSFFCYGGVKFFYAPKHLGQSFNFTVRTCSCKLCVCQTEVPKKGGVFRGSITPRDEIFRFSTILNLTSIEALTIKSSIYTIYSIT